MRGHLDVGARHSARQAGRLDLGDVGARPTEVTTSERVDESALVDQAASRQVDQEVAGFIAASCGPAIMW